MFTLDVVVRLSKFAVLTTRLTTRLTADWPLLTSWKSNLGVPAMRVAIIALLLTFASQAGAGCGNLCDHDWWKTATTADVQAELAAGADAMARNKDGGTPLHSAAKSKCLLGCKPGVIQALLTAGADSKAKNKNDEMPWDLAQENEKLKGTKAYWALNDAQYN